MISIVGFIYWSIANEHAHCIRESLVSGASYLAPLAGSQCLISLLSLLSFIAGQWFHQRCFECRCCADFVLHQFGPIHRSHQTHTLQEHCHGQTRLLRLDSCLEPRTSVRLVSVVWLVQIRVSRRNITLLTCMDLGLFSVYLLSYRWIWNSHNIDSVHVHSHIFCHPQSPSESFNSEASKKCRK